MTSRTRTSATARAGALAAAAIVGPVAVLGAGPAVAAPAPGAGTTVVRGTAMPVGSGLAHLSCRSPFAAGSSPATPYVGQGPGTAPLGQRSLGFDLAAGDAAGPVAYTGSLAAAGSASLSVNAAAGTTGVAWVGYRDPADPAGVVWYGRADLSVPAGGWRVVDTAGLTYTWTSYDAATGERLAEAAPATLADLLATRGDGPGLAAVTLGCDGAPFSFDAMRYDATTYDFEGLATTLTMGGGADTLVAGAATTVTGSMSQRPDVAVPHATALLERRTDDGWAPVRVVDVARDGSVSAIVEPPVRTTYRWRFADRPLAEAATSPSHVVEVARAVTARRDEGRVVGTVVPARGGLTVSLRRAGSGEVVATTTTSADGGYVLTAADLAAAGGGAHVATVAASDDNLRGESTPVQLPGAPAEPKPEPTPEPTPAPQPTPSAKPSRGAEPTREPDPTPSAPASSPAAPPTSGPTPEPTPEVQPLPTPAAPPVEPDASPSS